MIIASVAAGQRLSAIRRTPPFRVAPGPFRAALAMPWSVFREKVRRALTTTYRFDMPSINIHLDFFEHRQTRRLVAVAGRGSEVHLIRLWVRCARDNAETGVLADYSADQLESDVDWRGGKGKLVEGLIAGQWIEVVEGGFRLVNWLKWQGHIAKYRERGKIANEARWSNKYPTSIQQGCNKDAIRTPRAEQSRAEQKEPNSAGAGEVPSEAEILKFAALWPGDMARAIPAVIPEPWALHWLNAQEKSGKYPPDWRSAMARAFRADWQARRPNAVGSKRQDRGEAKEIHEQIEIKKL